MYNFDFYKGINDKIKHGSDVVYNLVQALPTNTPWFVYCDSFFSSIPLAIQLWNTNIYLTGTIRKNSKDIPKFFKEQSNKLTKNCTFWCMSVPQFLLHAVYDSKIVYFISTCHNPYDTSDKSFKYNKSSNDKSLEIPCVMRDYNNYMRGVDLYDQHIIYYSCNKKTRRWWLYLFWHMVDMAIMNALILFNFNNDNKFTQLQFREQLAVDLIGNFSSRKIQTDKITKASNMCKTQHFFCKSDKPVRCVVCSTERNRVHTSLYCKQCNVHLCAVPCFEIYHTK